MSKKIIFLWNPISGTADKERVKALIEKRCLSSAILPEFHATNAQGEYPDLEKLIVEERIVDVVAIGGDGTIRQVAKALRHLPVRFGLIPMGSGNGLALAAGIPKDPLRAIDIVIKGNHGPVDAFLINGEFSCMLSGIGFDAKVAHEFAKEKTRGLVTYAKVTARNFFTASAHPFVIHIGGRSIQTNAFFVAVANSNQFGNQFTIAPKASLSDGLVDIVVVHHMSRLGMIPAILHQLRFGEPDEDLFRKKNILYVQTPELEIENPTLAPLHIDGDPFPTAERFVIRCLPSAFRLLQP
jgi:YegS/Rv2252/BmrU family lipid kinase